MSFVLATLLFSLAATPPAASDYFTISVVDDQTGRGVPLVELRTVNEVRYVTDSAGLVAFHEPGLMNQAVFFHVRSHGYEFPADGFGFRGKALKTVPGDKAELRLKRSNIAQRLYRVTGEGIYRDSALVGQPTPIQGPLLNAQVVGSDSVNTVLFGGRVYWFWGDTNRPAYPLGTFHVPGATSRLPGDDGLDPARGVDLEYFQRADGFAASTAEMPGDGPTWIDGVCVIRDPARGERMLAKYMKVRKFLEVYERGLVEWNGEKQRFDKVAQFDFAAPLYPHGQALAQPPDAQEFVYFGNPYPLTRVRAQAEALADPRRYEAFTCLTAGSRLEKPKVERDARGLARYGWKRDTPAPTADDEAKWIKAGLLKENEAMLALREAESGLSVTAHAGSVAWNVFRRRWIMIVEQSGGTSNLGEIWYAEADTPQGPWVYAAKIVSHDKYSFYNPKQHAMFDQEGGRRIFFEGTYSTFFSGVEQPTPRYDYNQIMYQLDLDDARLVLPVPVYQQTIEGRQKLATGGRLGRDEIAFMALDRPRAGAVAIVQKANPAGGWDLSVVQRIEAKNGQEADVAFHALPHDVASPPKTSVQLFAWRHADKPTVYLVEGESAPADYKRSADPLCRVWRYPLARSLAWE